MFYTGWQGEYYQGGNDMKEYKVGDYLVHETNGVCVVDEIRTMALAGKGSEQLYYVLSPVYSSKSQVVTPVQSTKARVRDVKSKEELEQLLIDLKKCKNPFNCPHGRPTIVFYSNYDLEKMFKRSGFENFKTNS